jgi:hypothetical protein
MRRSCLICGSVRMLCGSSDQERMVQAGNVACTAEGRCACKILVGIPEGKRSLGRHTHRWGEITEIEQGMDWIDQAEDRDKWQGGGGLMDTAVNCQVP